MTGQAHASTSVTYEYPCAEGDPYYPVPRPKNAALYKQYEGLAERRPTSPSSAGSAPTATTTWTRWSDRRWRCPRPSPQRSWKAKPADRRRRPTSPPARPPNWKIRCAESHGPTRSTKQVRPFHEPRLATVDQRATASRHRQRAYRRQGPRLRSRRGADGRRRRSRRRPADGRRDRPGARGGAATGRPNGPTRSSPPSPRTARLAIATSGLARWQASQRPLFWAWFCTS
jgi:hypothetical protein